MLPDNAYVVIQSFMVDELHLEKTELLVYAVIHGFSQGGGGWFCGSNEYLARWVNSTPRTIQRAIAALKAKGLIQERSEGARFLRTTGDKMSRDPRQNVVEGVTKCRETHDKMSPNKDRDKDNHKDKGGRRFAPPTRTEVEAYARENGYEVDSDRFIAYYEGNGWKVGRNPMRDWRATVRSWHYRDHPKPKAPESQPYSRFRLRGEGGGNG